MTKRRIPTKRRKPKRVSHRFAHATHFLVILTLFCLINTIEKKAFRAKMKGHYKGEFNAAALLRQKPPPVEDDEDDK